MNGSGFATESGGRNEMKSKRAKSNKGSRQQSRRRKVIGKIVKAVDWQITLSQGERHREEEVEALS